MRQLFFKGTPVTIMIFLTCAFTQQQARAQQNNPLINSGKLLDEGRKLHDNQQYKEAIALYKQIDRSDTNYVNALYELSLSCQSDSQFDQAHQYALQGLRQYPEAYSKFGMQDANILDDMGKPAEAMKLYTQSLEKDPHSYILYFNKGITEINLEDAAAAKTDLQQCLLINPYYPSAHYFLGTLYLKQGNLVAAMLAFQTYLLISPSGKYMNKSVSYLNSIAKVTDDIMDYVKKRKSTGQDNFDMVQQILLSKIALDKHYELKADLEDNIVRQMQVVAEKLAYKRNDEGFAMQFYVPLYSMLFKENYFEPMVFSTFSGIGSTTVDNYLKKKKKLHDEFVDKVVSYLDEIKFTRVLTEPERKSAAIKYYYIDGNCAGKGAYDLVNNDMNMKGPWEFYHNNGQLKAKGNYNNSGKKEGEWTFYYNTGEVEEKARYKDGILQGSVEGWYNNGNLSYINNYENGKVSGYTEYYYNNLPRKSATFKEEKKNGTEKGYNSKGALIYAANYKDNEPDGMNTNYYENGNKEDEQRYVNGVAEGTYKGYYEDGTLKTQGEFVHNKKEGLWTTWFNSGAVKEKTTYKDDNVTGEFTEYHENGKLESKGAYDKKKIDGKIEYYTDEGRLYSDITYEKGKLREVNFYDASGAVLFNTSTRKGAADITFYSADGIKQSQGHFNKSGNRDGLHTSYFASGKVSEETNYKDDVVEGSHVTYYSNGKKSLENNFTAGLENGNSKGYYPNGKIKFDAWVIDGQKQQNIIFYNQLGDVTNREYYQDGERNGFSEYISPTGKKLIDYKYATGWIENIKQYDTLGKLLVENNFPKGDGPLIYKHFNGKISTEATYKNYMLEGSYKIYYFDGSPGVVSYYKHGELDSVYKNYYYGGQLESEGKYSNGNRTGLWKRYYPSGKLNDEQSYKNGLIQGVYKNYNEDGTLDKVIGYKDGELDGECILYGENNQVAVILNYKEGKLKSYTYEDKAGNKVPAILLKGGAGKVEGFYKNGNKSAVINFADHELQGERKFFYASGKPYIEGTRELSLDNGVKKVYHPNGNLWKEENYLDGNLHGSLKWYYPNGKPEKEEQYYDGERNGACRYYDEQGKLKQVRNYYFDTLLSVQ